MRSEPVKSPSINSYKNRWDCDEIAEQFPLLHGG
jgi:hypothetical protein